MPKRKVIHKRWDDKYYPVGMTERCYYIKCHLYSRTAVPSGRTSHTWAGTTCKNCLRLKPKRSNDMAKKKATKRKRLVLGRDFCGWMWEYSATGLSQKGLLHNYKPTYEPLSPARCVRVRYEKV
jgi:hypothetical protein